MNDKRKLRLRRKRRIRQRVQGTAQRPRLTVYRSLHHCYAQVVDDDSNQILASVSTSGKQVTGEMAGLNKTQCAGKVGEKIAAVCKQKGIGQVVFDRNGYRFHGRVEALASAAREAGLQF